ncbi:leucine-rich repeat extensin-like protein 3 [Iris pallida]|uniref:Leucine-rich repeat extensin-like protein 3 n=1 Tax=Iris pallida TaxID=29817 RepID=A0AAX6EZB7_IRIPA|nr:leucine-rich repeat extensin-like protein 3 [Iris pallida]KAJ6845056.1 leucine-rich repeat extensin-like protein 3 [Iris pallida]
MPPRPAPGLATAAIGRAQPLVARDSHPSPLPRSRNSGCSASVSLPGGSAGACVTAPSAPWSATTAENTPSRRAHSQDTSINFCFEPPRAGAALPSSDPPQPHRDHQIGRSDPNPQLLPLFLGAVRVAPLRCPWRDPLHHWCCIAGDDIQRLDVVPLGRATKPRRPARRAATATGAVRPLPHCRLAPFLPPPLLLRPPLRRLYSR